MPQLKADALPRRASLGLAPKAQKYRVKADINAGQHKPGDIIELTKAQAEAMPWAVELLAEPVKEEKPAPKQPVKAKEGKRKGKK